MVVENIYRHLQMGDRAPDVAAVEGVDEVGNPTILATFTVIAAILPMAFVSGLMGPYMRPIPVGASAAMLASLAVAFIITPYLALRLLRGPRGRTAPRMPDRAHEPEEVTRLRAVLRRRHDAADGPPAAPAGLLRRHRCAAAPGLDGARWRVKLVEVKMLPFDNKSEFQVVLDLPEGATLETSNAAAQAPSRPTSAPCPRS